MSFQALIPLVRANEKKIAWVFLCVIMGPYALNLISELDDIDTYEDYKMFLVPFYKWCSLEKPSGYYGVDLMYRNFLKSWFNCFSYKLGNDRVLPAMFSLGCVYLVYVLGHKMTNDRIVGLIAAGALMFNPLLTIFDTSPTYDQSWAFFFLLSMVLLYYKTKLSPVAYCISMFCKIYALGFLPMYCVMAYMEKKNWKTILASSGVISGIALGIISWVGIGNTMGFYPQRMEEGFLRIYEDLSLVLPFFMLLFGLDFVFKGRYLQSRNVVLGWLFWIMLTIPIVYLFSKQFMFGYRFVPFAAFLSIYCGMVLVKIGNITNDFIMKRGKIPQTHHK